MNVDDLNFETIAPKDIPFTQADDFEPPTKPKPRTTKLRKEIENIYALSAMAVFPFDPYIGNLLADNAENCATAWDELAARNPRVKKLLESLTQTSAYGAVIAAHLPIAVAVATKYVPQLRDSYEAQLQAMQSE